MIKLLSPCGNVDSLIAAINHNADAVYLGIDKFNARLNADNFTLDNLKQWVDYSHFFNVEVYLTLNTNIKQCEVDEAFDVAKKAYLSCVDGIIVSDLTLVFSLKKMLPNIKIIASTQLNICNIESARFVSQYCDGAVLSRECSIEDIKKITDDVDMQFECFCHGALCVSVSGQCLFSSIIGGNSGNRGLCAQPCRQSYKCADSSGKVLNEGYLLSPKDLCTIDNLDKFIDCNIKMLKIEGRNRRSEYVAQTLDSYRNALSGKNTDNEIVLLKQIFNRGNFTNGYAFNKLTRDIMYPNVQGHMGVNVGKIVKVGNKLQLLASRSLCDGDNFKIFSQGVESGWGAIDSDVSANSTCDITLSQGVNEGDEAHVTTSAKQVSQLNSIKRKITVDMLLFANCNQPIRLQLTANNITINVRGETLSKSISNKLTYDMARIQLQKTGATPFELGSLDLQTDDVFVNKAQLNNLRRLGLDKLYVAIIAKNYPHIGDRQVIDIELPKLNNNFSNDTCKSIVIIDENVSISELDLLNNSHIVLSPRKYSIETINNLIEKVSDIGCSYSLDLPNFATCDDIILLKKIIKQCSIKSVVANNVYALQLAKELNLTVIGGIGLNIYNNFTVGYLSNIFVDFTYYYSLELNLKEIWYDDNGYIYSEGITPIMTLCHCPIQLNTTCDCAHCKYIDINYVDKTGSAFKIARKQLTKCYFNILNCVPISCIHKYGRQQNVVVNLVDSSVSKQIIDNVERLKSGKKCDIIYSNNRFTTGHLYRGVK